MKYIKLMAVVVTVAMIMLPGFDSVYARGGGGGGHGGGGGGRGGGGHGGGGWHGGGRGDHGRGRWNGYNNNVYVAGGYDDGWGYGAEDDMTGPDSGQDIDDSTVVTEQPSTEVVQQPTDSIVPLGAQVTTLPPGSQGRSVGGAQLYQCGDTWYKPYFGANGVYYEVVPPPSTDN